MVIKLHGFLKTKYVKKSETIYEESLTDADMR